MKGVPSGSQRPPLKRRHGACGSSPPQPITRNRLQLRDFAYLGVAGKEVATKVAPAEGVDRTDPRLAAVVAVWERNLIPLMSFAFPQAFEAGRGAVQSVQRRPEPELPGQAGALSIPFVVLYRDGEPVVHSIGAMPKQRLEPALELVDELDLAA